MCTLKHGSWLNDEVINFYLLLVLEAVRSPYQNVYLFNSHFFSILTGRTKKVEVADGADGETVEVCDYKEVKQWTNRVNPPLCKRRLWLFPRNIANMHWGLLAAVIAEDEDGTDCDFEYCDSMRGQIREEDKVVIETYVEVSITSLTCPSHVPHNTFLICPSHVPHIPH